MKQVLAKECAVVCVWMIVRYYKGFISLSKLEEMLKTTRNGTTAYHIVEALKKLGFNAYGIRLDKLKATTIPFIANVIIDGLYKHYIVVYEVTDKYLLIADPNSSGIRKIALKEFYDIWTGINIEMYPTKIIINERPKNFFNVLNLIKINKKQVLVIGFLSIIITFLAICSSFFFQLLIDNKENNISNVIVFFLGLFLVKNIIDYCRGKWLIKYTYDIDKHITTRTFEQIIRLPYHYYHNHTSGEIISKINDLSILRDVMGKIILTIFIDLPLTLLSGILLFILNKQLFLIVIVTLILYIIIIFGFHKKINVFIDDSLHKKADVSSFMFESVSGFETVKGISIENKINDLFREKYTDYLSLNINLNRLLNKQNLCKNLINDFGGAFIIIIGINLVISGYISISTLITYNILASFFLEPIKNIIDLNFEVRKSYNSLLRILDLIDSKQIISGRQMKGNIEFKNVYLSINDISYVLKDINIKVENKNKVFITGKSGSGKSTLMKLIKGYYDNYEGEILIGNKKSKLADNIIYLSQKETIFTGTIDYNLTLRGNDNLEVIKHICYIDDITSGNELGGNILLEEDGFNISGGQKQRISLGRALHNFDILLIDEALSGIDVNLERIILKNLFNIYKNKTIIVVSHRLDNLDLFDQYIKLDDGKVIINSSKPRKGD